LEILPALALAYLQRVYDPRFILNSFDTLAPEAKVAQ